MRQNPESYVLYSPAKSVLGETSTYGCTRVTGEEPLRILSAATEGVCSLVTGNVSLVEELCLVTNESVLEELFLVIDEVPYMDQLCPLLSKEDRLCEYIELWLYTRCNPCNPVKLEIHSVATAPWVCVAHLIILIHGFTGNENAQINEYLRPAFLDSRDCNVMSVDWGVLCRPGCYPQAVYNMPYVARYVSDFIEAVVAHGIFRGCDIHILGHSLGAHVAAMASSFCNILIGRLTCFDTAHPLISDDDTDPGRAETRVAYHSNSGILGKWKRLGDVDVYFNNGVEQPGCGFNIACSHSICLEYYAESISCRKPIRAIRCDCRQSDPDRGVLVPESFDDECPAHTVDVGECVNTELRGSFIAYTRAEPPYLPQKDFYDCIRKEDPCFFDDMLDATLDCLTVPTKTNCVDDFC